MPFTPDGVIAHNWRKSVAGIRLFAGADTPLVAVLPADHRSTYYGGMRTHHHRVHQLVADLATAEGVATVDLAAFTRGRLEELNIDGAHWSWAIHRDVGTAMAGALLDQVVAEGSATTWQAR